MNLIFLILLAAIILIILLFAFALRINLLFDTDKSEMNVVLLWLNPFINAVITVEDAIPTLRVYVFKKLLFQSRLKSGKRKRNHGVMDLVKLSNPKDVYVNVHYGFRDPFTTGIACGVVNAASQFINIDSISHTPDFMSANDYIHLDATAKVNIGSALIKLFTRKSRS